MKINDVLHIIAGTFIMLSVALGHFVNPWWFAFTFFVGANMADILRKLGLKD